MIDPKIAEEVIHSGLAQGADFVDVFVEKNVVSTLTYLGQRPKDVKSGTDFGIGIRAIFGEKALYGYSNLTDRDELLRIVDTICVQERQKSDRTPQAISFSNKADKSKMTVLKGLDQGALLDPKIDFLTKIDLACRKHDLISQVEIAVMQRWQQIEIFNSEGLHENDERHYTRVASTAIAQDGNQQARGFHGPGGLIGWELADSLNPEEIADLISKRAITVLKAGPCPAGRMPVIIDNGFGGVIFHEACGHLLETTSVEKKASVFHDKMGAMIANPAVSATDDGTLEGYWGSLSIDDEGTKVQRTELIKEGKLTSFLVDRLGEKKTGFARTGSGRRQSYKFPPASRMRNTFIEAGPHEKQALFDSVKDGLYAKVMGGGSVTPGTGDFNFAVEEAYLIKNGKIGEAVRGATLIGSGPETLQKISMVANNFSLSPGMCGSVSGSIPVTVGQPAVKVDDILIGGEKS